MKTTILLFISTIWGLFCISNAQNCGTTIFVDEFNTDGNIPAEWTEVNTSDSVKVVDGRLRFNLGTAQPSAYRAFTPLSENVTVSFTEESTRNYVKCRFDVLSSDGQYLTSIMFGNNGAGSVQYATLLDANGLPTGYAGALIDHTYKKNYEYSFSIALDFTTHTFDFYADGILGGQDLPFIETAGDVAKYSITLLSMYSNEGRFFFDDVALSYPGADRSALSSAVANAGNISESGVISPLYGYSSEAYAAMQQVAEEGSAILLNCDATQTAIDETTNRLLDAISAYENSFVDEVVLKAYSGYNFTGEEYDVHCGYYNGGLDTLDNKMVSFKLEKGYMATFAQDVDGLGFSKVYIAQDAALELNLPEALQHSISFIRVSPWYAVGKKGSLGKKPWSDPENYNTEWYYNWGLGLPYQNSGFSTPEVQYVPMSWSKADTWTSSDKMAYIGGNMALNHHLAFNEPDNSGQSNLTVAQALEAYPKLLASGLRLGAPGVENVQYSVKNDAFADDAWIVEFMDSCFARGYRVDFIPVHDYIRRTTAQYIERFQALYERYNLPIWVTEYNYGNPNIGSADLTVEKGYKNIKAMTEAFEEADFIERYNWYYFFGNSSGIGGMSGDTLNITGQFYRDLDSPAPSYLQEEYVDGPYIEAGIEPQLASGTGISIHPNPVTGGKLRIEFSEQARPHNYAVHLYDMSGKEVSAELNTSTMNVSELQNGIYLLHIVSAELDVVQKIMIRNNL